MIEIPEPDVDGRYAILKIHSKNMSLGESIYLENIAELTERMNGSDLKSICTEAGMFAIRDDRDTIEMADFVMAIDKVRHNQKGSVSELSDGAMFA